MVKEYVLTLNDQDLNIISTALIEMPYKVSAPLIGKISVQLESFNASANTAEEVITERTE